MAELFDGKALEELRRALEAKRPKLEHTAEKALPQTDLNLAQMREEESRMVAGWREEREVLVAQLREFMLRGGEAMACRQRLHEHDQMIYARYAEYRARVGAVLRTGIPGWAEWEGGEGRLLLDRLLVSQLGKRQENQAPTSKSPGPTMKDSQE